jgi:hypothetical protein
MCRYALSESKDENNNSTRDVLKSLFYIYLSGTHATVDARTKFIAELVDSENPNKQELGLLLLDAALEATRICLNGKDSIPAATQVAQKLAKAIMEQRVYAFDYTRLLDSLAQVQPIVFLDVFMRDDPDNNQRNRMFSYDLVRRGSPLNQIPNDKLLSWCEDDPAVRYPLIASAIQAFTKSSETGKLAWKPVVHAMFERAPDLDAILEHLAEAIWPKSWSGSLTDILLSRAVLFQELYEHDNGKIRAWAKAQYSHLQESIRKDREWEEQRSRERNESFE